MGATPRTAKKSSDAFTAWTTEGPCGPSRFKSSTVLPAMAAYVLLCSRQNFNSGRLAGWFERPSENE